MRLAAEAAEKAEAAREAERQEKAVREARVRAEREVERIRRKAEQAGKRAQTKATDERAATFEEIAHDLSAEIQVLRAERDMGNAETEDQRDDALAEVRNQINVALGQVETMRDDLTKEREARRHAEGQAAYWKAKAVSLEGALQETATGEM